MEQENHNNITINNNNIIIHNDNKSLHSYYLEDNEKLQKENWLYKKLGCANELHRDLIWKLEVQENKIQEGKQLLNDKLQVIHGLNLKITELQKEKDQAVRDGKQLQKRINELETPSRRTSTLLKKSIELQNSPPAAPALAHACNCGSGGKQTESDEKKHVIPLSVLFKNPLLFDSIDVNQYGIDFWKYKPMITEWINSTKPLQFELLYRASQNENSIQAFHDKCDRQGPTITLIKTTEGDVFGGYNSKSWGYNFYGDKRCFIFTLINKHNIPPTKYMYNTDITNYPDKQCCEPDPTLSSCAPVFGFNPRGGSADICIKSTESFQSFPNNYIDTTNVGKSTLTRSKFFTVQDYEVYNVVELNMIRKNKC
ncbi:hypothetical protein CYY_002963 [Polysphondylium violaceum]|uniref:TLDc domain-containing protein n=1 Tax=Polysphondylium violaceum TaxID=133409 RepID=A0A8J4V0I3_9MYCE|nr:hypothetical protein CYY_002963 [Polysphondylium violaceum]